MYNQDIPALLAAARETAVEAGQLIKEKWHQPRQVVEKAFQDFVTDADIAAQTLITNRLRNLFPQHGFLTEEEAEYLPDEGTIIWIIDPVDGTTNYSRHQPIFCVSIAAAVPVQDGYRPLAGAVYDPLQDELFSAAAGEGAWLNDDVIRTSQTDTLSYTVIGVDWSYSRRLQRSTRDVLTDFGSTVQGVRSLGSAALGMAWVAAGRYDGYLNYNLMPWDVAAAWLLVQEAGGQITNTKGDAPVWDEAGIDCFISNGHIHDDFLQLLS